LGFFFLVGGGGGGGYWGFSKDKKRKKMGPQEGRDQSTGGGGREPRYSIRRSSIHYRLRHRKEKASKRPMIRKVGARARATALNRRLLNEGRASNVWRSREREGGRERKEDKHGPRVCELLRKEELSCLAVESSQNVQ